MELSERELAVIQAVADGLGNKQIADRMNTTEQVIKNICNVVFEKIGAENRAHAVACCLRRSLID